MSHIQKAHLSPMLSVRSETDVSQPCGFISYFHNDISLVTEGQQAWREQTGPVKGAPAVGRTCQAETDKATGDPTLASAL